MEQLIFQLLWQLINSIRIFSPNPNVSKRRSKATSGETTKRCNPVILDIRWIESHSCVKAKLDLFSIGRPRGRGGRPFLWTKCFWWADYAFPAVFVTHGGLLINLSCLLLLKVKKCGFIFVQLCIYYRSAEFNKHLWYWSSLPLAPMGL